MSAGPSKVSQVAATADITTTDVYLREVVLTGGSDAATLTVRAGGSGGTVILVLKAAANTTSSAVDMHDTFIDGGLHATLAGTSPSAAFVYAQDD